MEGTHDPLEIPVVFEKSVLFEVAVEEEDSVVGYDAHSGFVTRLL
jgi:hypothetical protein